MKGFSTLLGIFESEPRKWHNVINVPIAAIAIPVHAGCEHRFEVLQQELPRTAHQFPCSRRIVALEYAGEPRTKIMPKPELGIVFHPESDLLGWGVWLVVEVVNLGLSFRFLVDGCKAKTVIAFECVAVVEAVGKDLFGNAQRERFTDWIVRFLQTRHKGSQPRFSRMYFLGAIAPAFSFPSAVTTRAAPSPRCAADDFLRTRPGRFATAVLLMPFSARSR